MDESGRYTMNYDRTKGTASRRYSVVVFFLFFFIPYA